MDLSYKIGDLAREFEVTLRTLRFYEDRGLITPARAGTTRLYSEDDRERLRIALLSLGEIREVLLLHDSESDDDSVQNKIRIIYAERLKALEKHQTEISETISDLQSRIEELNPAAPH